MMLVRPKPKSLTHQHIAAVLATEAVRFGPGQRVPLLDAGCGEGDLLAFLSATLPLLTEDATWDFFGFDVTDSTSIRPNFPFDTIARLEASDPSKPWGDHIRACTSQGSWPFEAEAFSVVVTNQVLEHVRDIDHFLRELRRVLAPGGMSVNLFPLRSALFEGHLLTPLTGQLKGHEQRSRWLESLYRLGLGKSYNRSRGSTGADEGADYIQFATYYRRLDDFVRAAKPLGLRVSYRYSGEFYRQKIRKVMNRSQLFLYTKQRVATLDWLAFAVCRYLSSITLILERPPSGSRFGRI